jgi:hypothetical protein
MMRIASPPRFRPVAEIHRGGEQQQTGTDLQMRQIGGFEVDVEADFIVFKMEADHPAIGEEVGGFTHGENRQAAQALERRALPPGLVPAEKEDVASLDFLRLAELADVKYP